MTQPNVDRLHSLKPRWLLALMAALACSLGWLGLPSIHQWLGALIREDGVASWLAALAFASIYWVLLRAVADVVTDIYDWRLEGRHDWYRDRLTIVDGRFGWGPTILMFWTNVEVIIAGIAVVSFMWATLGGHIHVTVHASVDDPWGWWRSFVGWVGVCLAGFSLLGRGEAAIFPLPYRWLGFARNATEQEARECRWPWSKERSDGV